MHLSLLECVEDYFDMEVKKLDQDLRFGISDLSMMDLLYKKFELYYRIKLMHKTLKEQIFNEKK